MNVLENYRKQCIMNTLLMIIEIKIKLQETMYNEYIVDDN